MSTMVHKRTLHHLTRSASLLKADMRELHLDMSGKCQKQILAGLFNHLVGAANEREREAETQCLGCL